MKPKAGVLTGSKISSKHSTYTETAEIVIVYAKRDLTVTKIVLGKITRTGSGKRNLKFEKIRAGFKVTVRGEGAQQILYLYTQDPGIPSRITASFR